MNMWLMLDKLHAQVVDSSFDEESDQSKGLSKNLPHNRVDGHLRLYKDCFGRTDLVYPKKLCQRRYMMSRDMFMVILRGARDYYPYLFTE
jgi:hypothetical protein